MGESGTQSITDNLGSIEVVMKWYYVHQGRQTGPLDAGQLVQLHQDGKVQDDTLIWHEGMPDWQPYAEVNPQGSVFRELSPSPSPPVAKIQTGSGDTIYEAVCAECGKLFDHNQTSVVGNTRVCVSCKPAYLQKVAERGKAGKHDFTFAGFGTRFGALFIDAILVWVIYIAISLIAGVPPLQALRFPPRGKSPAFESMLLLTVLVLSLGYEILLVGKFGATLGKMAHKIKVVTPEGEPVSFLQALSRAFAKSLSTSLCYLGFIIAAFDNQRRALHDRLCETRVIQKDK